MRKEERDEHRKEENGKNMRKEVMEETEKGQKNENKKGRKDKSWAFDAKGWKEATDNKTGSSQLFVSFQHLFSAKKNFSRKTFSKQIKILK